MIYDIFDGSIEIKAVTDTSSFIGAVTLIAEIERPGGEKMTVHLYFSAVAAKKITAAIDSKIAQVARNEFDPR